MSTNPTDDTLFVEAWQASNEEVPSDQAAADFLYDSLVIYNKIECLCRQPQIVHKPGDRFYSCRNCKKVSWVTSGTLFAGVVKLRAWLALVWLKERGITISAVRFSRLLEIAQSTALNIQKRLGMVLEESLDESSPSLPAQFLLPIIIKRSKETPAQEHPRSELAEALEHGAQFLSLDQWESFSSKKEDLSAVIAAYLETSDWCLASSHTSDSIASAIKAAIAYIRTYFHGVSRKCLQLYLAFFWCHFDRARWSQGAILLACLEHPPISYESIVRYVSPPAVKLFCSSKLNSCR
ncbi:hypothetical protein KBI23_23490 [bacterium]|nr:hypothetical protein [bacterium]